MADKVGGSIGSTIMLIMGMGATVMLLIFVGIFGGTAFDTSESKISDIGQRHNIVNETITVLNNTVVSLANRALTANPAIVVNNTQAVLAGNFTFDLPGGTVTLVESTYRFNNTAMNATYTYRNQTIEHHITDSILSSFDALEQTSSYLTVFVLAIIIMIVLSLVFAFSGGFGIGRSGGKGGVL